MPRVSHRKVMGAIRQAKDSITDNEFFTGSAFKALLTDYAESLTGRYKFYEKIHVQVYWDEDDKSIARTDGFMISINAGCDFVVNYHERLARFHAIRGLLLHEVGHLLFTDFDLFNESHKRFIKKRELYPVLVERTDAMEEFIAFINGIHNKSVRELLYDTMFDFNNAIEDGYVNNAVTDRFPGFKADLEDVLLSHYESCDSFEKYEELENAGKSSALVTVFSMVHQLAVFAQCKANDSDWGDYRMKAVLAVADYVNEAVEETNARKRLALIYEAFATLLPLYRKNVEELLTKYGNAEEREHGEISEADMTVLSELIDSISQKVTGGKSSVIAKSEEADNYTQEEISLSDGGSSPLEATGNVEDPEGSSKDLSNNTVEGSEASSATGEYTESDESFHVCKITAETEKLHQIGNPSSEEAPLRDAVAEDAVRNRAIDRTTVNEEVGKKTREKPTRIPISQRVEDKKPSCYDKVLSDTERILQKMASDRVNEILEKEREEELSDFAAAIAQPEIYNRYKARISRISAPDQSMIDDYEKLSPFIKQEAKRIAKPFEKIVSRKRNGEKLTGLSTGRRLEVRTIPRGNGKYFSKKTMPSDKPTISVALLVDESTSMDSGDRITYARYAASVLYEFCQILGIPVAVYGHTTEYGIEIHSYAEFNTIDKNDKYRIMDIRTYGGNIDGYAMRFVAERQLKEARADIMINIVISDGQPNGGSAVCEDMAAIVKKYKKDNMIIVGAAIGKDREKIKAIYGESNFLNISDLEALPKKLTGLVKPYIK